MGWQKQLRRLDSELANGVISYAQYRQQRDAVLAGMAGTRPMKPTRSPYAGRSQHWASTNPSSTRGHPEPIGEPNPVGEPEGARQPAPVGEPEPAEQPAPANEPESVGQSEPGNHPESVEAPATTNPAELLASTRPTTAPSPADELPTESIPYPDPQLPPDATTPLALPTQPTQPLPTRQPPPRSPQGQPWAGTPLALGGHPTQARARAPAWLWLTLALLLVFTLIIGGAWWLAARPTESRSAASAPLSPPTQPRKTTLEDRLPALPGQPAKENSTLTVRKGLELGLYSPDAAARFTHNGASEVVYRGSTNGADHYRILVIATQTPAAAKATVDYLRATALDAGLTAHPIRGTAGATGTNDTARLGGSWYTSGTLAVGAGISTRPSGDNTALSTRLSRTVASLQEALPRG